MDAAHADALDRRLGQACSVLDSVVGAKAAYLGKDEESATPPRLDGGIATAFDITLAGVLDRIDRLVGDDRVWKTPPTARRLSRREAAARVQLVEEAVVSVNDGNRPSHKYRVNLAYLDNGSFAAMLPLRDGSMLAGFGDSADAAMKDFDRVWRRNHPDYTPLPQPMPAGVVGPDTEEEEEEEDEAGPEQPPESADETA